MHQVQPVIIPAKEAHSHTVVFLHDRGDNAESLSVSLRRSLDSRQRSLYDVFPTFRWVFPRSGETVSFSAAGNAVSQWFDIWNLQDYSDREEIQTLGLRNSTKLIRQILAVEADLLGGRWDRIILAGIGQGAATATHVLLNVRVSRSRPASDSSTSASKPFPGGLGAFVGFSSRMPFPGRGLAETRRRLQLDGVPDTDTVVRKTPVLLGHYVDDQVIPVEHGRVLRDTLQGFGAQVEWREYKTGRHWLHSPSGMDEAADYLNHVLGLRQSSLDLSEKPESEAVSTTS
ncbi:hypothetical protein E4U17_003973 [Claviceps sp. LM77 group G4]|nr:hypothetical protein E4U17_003973 [Claviceps sp. LM77 group G4]KAG6073625.1 hypothetical protein E4U33_002801 [Claviceps sp. LM78 group G4]KAG6077364.1 hypothetical protein E4U16_002264 [Claviceps sp. LM84 group G4]